MKAWIMGQNNRNLAVILFTIWLGFVGFSMPYPVLTPLLLNDQGMLQWLAATDRPLIVGLVLSTFAVGQLFGSPWLGKYSDRFGRKPMLIFSLAGATCGYLITAWGVTRMSLAWLVAGRLVTGLCEGNIAISNAIAADLSDWKSKAETFTYIAISINLAWIAGPLIGGWLADENVHPMFGFELPFWVGAGLSLCALLMVVTMLKETRSPDARQNESTTSAVTLIKQPALRHAFVISFLAVTAIFLYFEYFAFHYYEKFNLGTSPIANYTALVSLPLIAAGLIVPTLSKRMSIRSLNCLGAGLLCLGLSIYGLAPTHFWTIGPMCIACAGIAVLWVSTSLAVSNSVANNIQGQAMGLYRSINVLGEICAALLGGWLASHGTNMPFIGAAMIALATVMVSWFSRQRAFQRIAQQNAP